MARAGVLHMFVPGNKTPKLQMVRSEHAALQKIWSSKIKGKDDADFVF